MPKRKKPAPNLTLAEQFREYVASLMELNRLNAALLKTLSSLSEKIIRKHKKTEPRLLQNPDRKRGGKK